MTLSVHRAVLLEEVINGLKVESNKNYIDCTFGAGGHSIAILQKNGPIGKLLAIDWDTEAIIRAKDTLKQYKNRIILINDNYRQVKKYAYENGFNSADGVLLDLGLSLDQLQNSGRGFSFQQDEPLDMRFSVSTKITAEFILNNYTESELRRIFLDYGEEHQAHRLAKAIVESRAINPIKSTLQLVQLITANKKRDPRKRINPATQVFQALRIEVNSEFENIENALRDIVDILCPGGRLVVITFHSLEDRIVKKFFKAESTDCHCSKELPQCVCNHKASLKMITRKAIKPSDREISENFRARSAKLRVIEKI
ncbi:16S rRNA (cytosine(1402)-N(4))-methyltransferase [Candidatus Falkowbacteria bacterium RIFOXYD2_FULL_35_9]|uniref:Ribosomal RNA small subunit methyltransferase H n=1 Tax=Candidatus Falkowbacteria bacterium RIFOXYC2_FULL_36_12 TaxID=1798002 RepID=A0A1F5SYD1_9BACT|nr:MAG: 16S rRNA (cytosine(1402)-N(4))-methyltransferase [Candidatus Falkowbacteria bacterium RIFOXYB2_FULL_35_7]OGF31700.1 MAG: 16S rRNA (cytosine(1402)-N(4))-methyltransferase [Candidatus Falkowbacteria bacterium RIFOXYC2_FULL_36_12]OGF33174.1 MAG: 16S rRNA (cytosine(1402)-N(4))-methyltransferase [Candidatus Falkowbacteria bacterium RIFOXYA2_FULL_35_8]OGF46180.1 MAG: 16S rRNA (cytosine(1402)-N(4))-methyltransferase [Candidatus Falkowbacteria bacterium RIFOXYD2_FULL_35_9]